MKYAINKQPDFSYETIRICTDIASGVSIESQLEIIALSHGKTAKNSVATYFASAVGLLECFRAKIELGDLDFLFRRIETAKEPLASIFTSNARKDPREAILAYVLNDRSSEHDVLHFVESLDAHISDAAQKYDLVKLNHGFDKYRAAFAEILERGKELINGKLADLTMAIDACMGYIEAKIKNDGLDFIRAIMRVDLPDNVHCDIYPSVYDINSSALTPICGNRASIYIGLHYFDIAHALQNRTQLPDANMRNFLKCIADATKLSILQMIRVRPMYGGQIAKELNLTTATISHHISALVNARLIFLKKDGTRVYYYLDNDEVLRQIAILKGMFERNTFTATE